MAGKTEQNELAGDGLSSRLLNSLMLMLIGAALGLFWHDAVQAAVRVIHRLT